MNSLMMGRGSLEASFIGLPLAWRSVGKGEAHQCGRLWRSATTAPAVAYHSRGLPRSACLPSTWCRARAWVVLGVSADGHHGRQWGNASFAGGACRAHSSWSRSWISRKQTNCVYSFMFIT